MQKIAIKRNSFSLQENPDGPLGRTGEKGTSWEKKSPGRGQPSSTREKTRMKEGGMEWRKRSRI